MIPLTGERVETYNGFKNYGFKTTMLVFITKYFFPRLEKDLKSNKIQTKYITLLASYELIFLNTCSIFLLSII